MNFLKYKKEFEEICGNRLEIINETMVQFTLTKNFFKKYKENLEFEDLTDKIFNETGERMDIRFYIKPPKELHKYRKSFCRITELKR